MELTVTEPIFLWLLGSTIVLIIALLTVSVALAFQLLKLSRYANEKSQVVGAAIDEVRSATHVASESLRVTSEHVAQFVSFTTSAAGLAKLVSLAREAWTSWSGPRRSTKSHK